MESSNPALTFLVAAAGPVAAGLIGVFGVWFKEWRDRRDQHQKRQKWVQQATEDIAFLRAWLDAHERVAPEEAHVAARRRAQWDLERTYGAFTKSWAVASTELERQQATQTALLRRSVRWLFLIGFMKTTVGKILTALYLTISGLALLLFIALSSSEIGSNGLTGSSIGFILFSNIFFVGPVLLLRWTVRGVDALIARLRARSTRPKGSAEATL